MKMKRWTSILCILCVALATMAICSGCSKETEETSSEEQTEETTEMDLTEVYAAYSTFISDKQSAIEAYNWQRDVSSEIQRIQKPVALCDINGDNVPELFCMEAENAAEAYLHIYTYADGNVEELDYSLSDTDSKMEDVDAGAGTNYVVYLGNDGNLYIYYTHGSESISYCLDVFKVDGTSVERTKSLKNVYGPSDDNNGEVSDKYYEDGNDVDTSEGESLFKDAFKKINQAIIYSGYDDNSIWSGFSTDSAKCMAVDDLLAEMK